MRKNGLVAWCMRCPFLIFLLGVSILHASNQEAVAPQVIDEFSPSVITESGYYKLATDAVGTITISASCVTLDLNGYCIANGSNHGVVINNSVSKVTVRNGTIFSPTNGNGIEIASGCDSITISNIGATQCNIGLSAANSSVIVVEDSVFLNNANEGVKLDGCSRCSLFKCRATQNIIGFLLDQCNDSILQDCFACNNASAGYSLDTATGNMLISCKSLEDGGSSIDTFGFVSEDGAGNLFERCYAEGTITSAMDVANVVAGFAFRGAESCSSIVASRVSGIQAPSNGLSTAYGIRLEESLGLPSALASGDIDAIAYSCQWHPKVCNFFALGGRPAERQTRTYRFDSNNNSLRGVQGITHRTGRQIRAVDWTKDGNYLAVVGNAGIDGYEIRVYGFDLCTHMLELLVSADHNRILYAVAWSPDGRYLLVGGNVRSGFYMRLFRFEKATNTLTEVQGINHGARVRSVRWSPDGRFVAVGGNATGGNELFIYEFDILTELLTLRDSQAHGAIVRGVSWSWDGRYVAMVGSNGTDDYDVRIYEFDATAKTLTLRDSKDHGAVLFAVDWSPCGRYLVVGGSNSSGVKVRVYSFDPAAKTLALKVSSDAGPGSVYSASWASDGGHIVFAGVEANNITHQVFSALNFPSGNVVVNNHITCTAGNSVGWGTGLNASSCTNLVKNNMVYANNRDYCFASNLIKPCHLCRYNN